MSIYIKALLSFPETKLSIFRKDIPFQAHFLKIKSFFLRLNFKGKVENFFLCQKSVDLFKERNDKTRNDTSQNFSDWDFIARRRRPSIREDKNSAAKEKQ